MSITAQFSKYQGSFALTQEDFQELFDEGSKYGHMFKLVDCLVDPASMRVTGVV